MSILSTFRTDQDKEQELLQLMAEHKTSLMRIAYMYLGDEAPAEDAVQDTFMLSGTRHRSRRLVQILGRVQPDRLLIDT